MMADPYRYLSRRSLALGSDVFESRLLLRRTICMTGPEAVALFYDRQRFQREGAAPEPLRATLFGKGAVQGLDGEAHRWRKSLFMRVVDADRVDELLHTVGQHWELAAQRWSGGPSFPLYHALHPMLTQAVCEWAGVPVPQEDLPRRSEQLTALFDQAAAPGLGHFRSRRARSQIESWLSRLIDHVRAGHVEVAENKALYAVAWFRDEDGKLLAPSIAAVELANLLRPTVAVSVFIVFVAHALQAHPHCREALAGSDNAWLDAFVQEVRRWYPFFPAVVALVREDFEWRGLRFARGRRAMLDLYGTNHDPRSWERPDAFLPERFLPRAPTPFDFVPQGGADAATHHRCPGEGITIALMRQAARFLGQRLRYSLPAQDLSIDFGRLPALPRDRMILGDIRLSA
ncbi:cytochrome P450 [Cupriavidus sp. AU9028]|nr:cytochrome P450 [Cupriavidus sp. AU9028]